MSKSTKNLSIQTEVYSLFSTMNFYATQQTLTLSFSRTNSIDKYDEKTKKFCRYLKYEKLQKTWRFVPHR